MAYSRKKQNSSTRKKDRHKVLSGIAHVKATFNNTLISFTDSNGNVLAQSSAGACGFKGSKKSTPFAASVAAKKVAEIVVAQYGMKSVWVVVSGPGPGRESAIRGVAELMKVERIDDVTPIPHNGCRAEKERRV